MKTLKRFAGPAVAVVAGFVFVLPLNAAAQAPEKARPTAAVEIPAPASTGARPAVSIGFVDMELIIEQHPETKAKADELQQRLKTRIDELRQQAESVRAMETDLDLLTEGSPEYRERLREIRRRKASIDLDQKILRVEMNLQLVDALKKIYEQSKQVVAEVARERGFTIVAMYSSGPVNGRNRNELITDIVTRPFIYHDQALDITQDVLGRLRK
jgi:Skp family chaperone for outer membrane proteins